MSGDIDWNLYRSFLAVMEEGSLSAAARRLALAQPTVARHIDILEDRIGIDLFIRTQTGLVPTDMGENLRPYAETLAHTAAALLRKASEGRGVISGTVRISASEIIGVELLPQILANLRRQHPALVVELVISNSLDDLLRRSVDVAIRNVQPTQGVLVAQKVPSAELGLHARRDYLERRGIPATMADLAGHDLIGFDRETPAMHAMVQKYPMLARESFALRVDNNLAQLAAIRAGFGIGVCNVAIANREGGLVRVLADMVSIPLGVWIVMHEDLKTSGPCQAVFSALAAGLNPKLD